eukprot:4485884-Amphidinium_carterae.1
MWLCFHALLRTAEVLHLAVADVQVDLSRMSAVLSLRGTKSGQRFGSVESIIVDDAQLVLFLAGAVRNKPLGARVVPFTYAKLHRSSVTVLCRPFLSVLIPSVGVERRSTFNLEGTWLRPRLGVAGGIKPQHGFTVSDVGGIN